MALEILGQLKISWIDRLKEAGQSWWLFHLPLFEFFAQHQGFSSYRPEVFGDLPAADTFTDVAGGILSSATAKNLTSARTRRYDD
jgi:hypothetical protein